MMKEDRERVFVNLDTNEVVYNSSQSFSSGKFMVDDILYAYAVKTKYQKSQIFVFDHHQHRIDSDLPGFGDIVSFLASELNFDVSVFDEIEKSELPLKKEIYRKICPVSYQVLGEYRNDYQYGFEILSDIKEFVYWDTKAQIIMDRDDVYIAKTPYDQNVLRFKHPVRVGNIVFHDLYTHVDGIRFDLPFLMYYGSCFSRENNDSSYNDLKAQFQNDFEQENQKLQYERWDQKSYKFLIENISFSLVYTYDNDWQFDGGDTSFAIENLREYPQLLIDEAYEKSIEIDTCLIFESGLSFQPNYKNNDLVKIKPTKLKDFSDSKPLVWIDKINGYLGFASTEHSIKYKLTEIKEIIIQNILPAKGNGCSYLELSFNDNKRYETVFRGRCYDLDNFQNPLKMVTGFDVIMAEPYHDC